MALQWVEGSQCLDREVLALSSTAPLNPAPASSLYSNVRRSPTPPPTLAPQAPGPAASKWSIIGRHIRAPSRPFRARPTPPGGRRAAQNPAENPAWSPALARNLLPLGGGQLSTISAAKAAVAEPAAAPPGGGCELSSIEDEIARCMSDIEGLQLMKRTVSTTVLPAVGPGGLDGEYEYVTTA